MVDVTPKTRITIKVAKDQISYLAGKTKLSYDQTVERIQAFLEYLKKEITSDLKIWINRNVPKRTGQLRALLIQWLEGSNIYKNVLRIIIGTNLPYAGDVNEMTTAMVRHQGEKGYVYYPNIYGIRGKVILMDPMAIGGYFTALLDYAESTALIWIAKAKGMMW